MSWRDRIDVEDRCSSRLRGIRAYAIVDEDPRPRDGRENRCTSWRFELPAATRLALPAGAVQVGCDHTNHPQTHRNRPESAGRAGRRHPRRECARRTSRDEHRAIASAVRALYCIDIKRQRLKLISAIVKTSAGGFISPLLKCRRYCAVKHASRVDSDDGRRFTAPAALTWQMPARRRDRRQPRRKWAQPD